MVIGIAVGILGYRSAYAAVVDFRYNHIPLPPFGARSQFAYGKDTHMASDIGSPGGDSSGDEHPVMWSWWTRSGATIQEQGRRLSWQKSMGCVGEMFPEKTQKGLRDSTEDEGVD